MSRYYTHTPMEYEYDNGTGPIDNRSPFANLSSNAQRFPTSRTPAKPPSAFDSPAKSRPMGSHQSSPQKPLPPTPSWNALFNTPRGKSDEFDDSSAGETPRSPEQRDDSEAGTPDMGMRSAKGKFDAACMPAPLSPAKRGSPTKERPTAPRRDPSFFSTVATKMKNRFSPGRGEVARVDHSGGIEKSLAGKSVARRRMRDADRRVARERRRSVSGSEAADDDDNAASPVAKRKKSSQRKDSPEDSNRPHWVASLFTFIGQHPTVPHILSFYAQLAFNVFLLAGCGYLMYIFWSAVQGDVDKKSHEAKIDIMREMAACAEQYNSNKCGRDTRMPALETVCENWSKCTNQNPDKVGRARVSAHTFAEIFNSFVEPISWKAMIFTSMLVFGCFAISNFAFGILRHRTQQYNPGADYGYSNNYAPPPPTPQRHFSGQEGTPWPLWYQGPPLEPQPSGAGGAYGQIDGRGSPVRRLKYN